MDNEVAMVREEIDRRTRPGQTGTATLSNRLPTFAGLGASKTTPCNVYDWTAQSEKRYGLYGRGEYGSARYLRLS